MNKEFLEKFKIHRLRITKDNIGLFHSIDGRVGSDRFNEERDWLEKEIVKFVKNGDEEYPERYDLTVFVYNQNEEPWLLTDGSHRTQALLRLFERGEIDHFDIILLPDALIPWKKQPKDMLEFYREANDQSILLNKMLKEEGLPTWIRKFEIELQNDGTYFLWANVKAISSGGKDMTMMTIPEYQATREQQPK